MSSSSLKDALYRLLELEPELSGVVAAVSWPGGDADAAVGLDAASTRLDSDRPWALYCAAKPLLALAIARLVSSGACGFDTPLADLVPAMTVAQPQVTLRQLMCHQAGFNRPGAFDCARHSRPWERSRCLAPRRSASVTRGVAATAYSEAVMPYLLGEAIEMIAGVNWWSYVLQTLQLVGASGPFWHGTWAPEFGRLTVARTVGLDVGRVPLLVEQSPELICAPNPSYSVYGTPRALADLYKQIGKGCGSSIRDDVLKEMLLEHTRGHDATLGRDCSFALGFMVNLAGHCFGDGLSPESFGHSGFHGATCAGHDPSLGVSFAVATAGVARPETALTSWRPTIMSNVLEAAI